MIAAAAPLATFLTVDTTTQENWPNRYGAAGYPLPNGASQLPPYVEFTLANQLAWTWAASTTDPRALQRPGARDRLATTWYIGAGAFTLDVNLTDGQAHEVALYCVDWDSTQREQIVEVLDAASGALLDSRSVTAFTPGDYLVWSIRGPVQFCVTHTRGDNAVISRVFFADEG